MDNLKSIPSKFRPSPFWSWNDELEPEELREQIRKMHDVGIGGFFMHARSGLRTEYMGERWMECVKACVDEAHKLGMDAWLYDENGWPSGFAGGMVNRQGIDFQQKYLRCSTIAAKDAKTTERTIAFYTGKGELMGKEISADYCGDVIECHYDVNPYYVDNLDAKVVASFLHFTHERYASMLTKEEMSNIRGIFTDEPQISRNGIPWSFILEEEYQKAYNHDLLNDLPKLFHDYSDSAPARIRFWRLCSRLFAENFLKQISEWCTAHGWQLTGHHVLEETYYWQLVSNGSIMPQYQYYDVPGMDHLGRLEPNIVTMKQVTSIAAQTGKKQILTESFALTGWNMNMRGMKWMYQYQMAHGINYLCQHLVPYSMRGMRKRDYPLGSFYQNPWWNDYRVLNDYFARTGMLLAEGEIKPDILVFHGQSTAWTLYDDSKYAEPIIDKFTKSLLSLSEALDARRMEYHYADEQMLRTIGGWKDGKPFIGKMSYNALMLPQISNLTKEAMALIEAALDAGLPVYGVRNQLQPHVLLVEGIPADDAQKRIFSRITMFDNEISAANAMSKVFAHPIVEENGENACQIVAAKRYFDDLCGRKGTLYYMVNRRAEEECRATITLPENGAIEALDLFSCEFSAIPSNGFKWDFAPAGAAAFFVSAEKSAATNCTPNKPVLESRTTPTVYIPTNNWTLDAASANILPLDKCEYRIDGGEWIAEDVSVIHDRLLKLQRECKLDIRFRFTLEEEADSPMQLGVETPERFTFMLNSEPFNAEVKGFLFEKSIKIIDLPKAKKGENILEMSMDYWQASSVYAMLERAKEFETEFNMRTFDSEVENVFLLGNFAVRCDSEAPLPNTAPYIYNANGYGIYIPSVLCKAPFTLHNQSFHVDISDFQKSGFAFFAGKITVSKRVMLTGDEVKNTNVIALPFTGFNSARVEINGKEIGIILWEPFTLTIPKGVLHEGENTISIELTTSLRNMLGPFHSCNGDDPDVATYSFSKEPNVLGKAVSPYQPDYCLTTHGIAKITLGAFAIQK